MTSSPALIAALVVVLPFAALFIAGASLDVCRSRRERADHVLATCMGLRLTESHLIVGYRSNARRIPLVGLTVSVEDAEADHGPGVLVAVRGLGEAIDRRQPYSYAASGEAQIFATMFARLSRALQPATPAVRRAV